MPAVLAASRLRSRHLAWLPAVMLTAWAVLAAAGVPLTPSTNAATGSSTVTATVAVDIHIGGTCATYSNSFGNMPDATNSAVGTCGITFGTNNGATSTLKVESARTTAGNNMFCRATSVSAACEPSGFAAPLANAASLAIDQFGVLTTAITSCTTPAWTLNTYNPVPDSTTAGTGTTVCSMTGTTDGNYSLEFRAYPDTVAAGTYSGQAVFTVEAT